MSEHVALSPLKQAFLALQEAQSRIADLESRRSEPVAIIGVGCRIPGAEDGPEGYWSLLHDGVNAVGDKSFARWRACGIEPRLDAGDEEVRWSALLRAPELFDPQFFGISPREAANLDPQQRLLLEVSWEALEDAAIVPSSTYGSRTGVYFGIASNDFAEIELVGSDYAGINPHLASGGAHSVAAGRVSYTFGWHGPAISLDTACSSSLVAVHLACEAIRGGDFDMALAGGVNLILSPASSIAFARSGMLSSCGRVDAFGLGADGFVRGEGCGVVVLKRLSSAERDGDRVLAVIAGSAVNHDGPGSGLTVPNGQAQAALLRSALRSAGIAPWAVGYVEAHGTGTRLGDPIEAEALGAVFGAQSGAQSLGGRARPLLIGSVKTNIGHLEAAAGIAGLIKVVLALEHGELPAQLHGDPPSEHVRWSELPLEVVRERRQWDPIEIGGASRRLAGVSGFGFSGTNAHVIVEEAPARELLQIQIDGLDGLDVLEPDGQDRLEVLVLSAKSAVSLEMLCARYWAHLEAHPEQDWRDVCYTAAVGRTHFKHRLAVVAGTREQAMELLQDGGAGWSGLVQSGAAQSRSVQSGAAQSRSVQSGSVFAQAEPDPGQSAQAAVALAREYAAGAEIDWVARYASGESRRQRQRVRLPGYAFERERHWLPGSRQEKQPSSAGLRGHATGHPLLGERLRLAGEGTRYEWVARPEGVLAWLGEHRIGGRAILPATAFLEMLLAAGERLPGTEPVRVEELSLLAPLPVSNDVAEVRTVQVTVEPAGSRDDSRSRVRIYSISLGSKLGRSSDRGLGRSSGSAPDSASDGGLEDGSGRGEAGAPEWQLHGEGYVARSPLHSSSGTTTPKTRDPGLNAVRERCTEAVDAAAFYARMAARGADFGLRFKGVQRVWRGEGEVLGEITLEAPSPEFGRRLHPASLDACLQIAAGLLPQISGSPSQADWLPARLDRVEYHQTPLPPAGAMCLVHARLLPATIPQRANVSFNIYLKDTLQPVVSIGSISLRREQVPEDHLNSRQAGLHSVKWERCEATAPIKLARTWIVLDTGAGIGREAALGGSLADELRAIGQKVVISALAGSELSLSEEVAGIVYLHKPLGSGSEASLQFTAQAKQAVEELLQLCRRLSLHGTTGPRLYVVTSNAHAVAESSEIIFPLEAIVSGVAATISSENAAVRCTRLDIVAAEAHAATLIAGEIAGSSSDDWIAFRHGIRYLPRLEAIHSREKEKPKRITWMPGHGIESLAFTEAGQRSPGQGEVEIALQAAGLNFHDVLSVLGVLPDTDPLGSECSGRVTRVGPGVTTHKVGDKVVAIAPAALATMVIAAEDLTFPKPTSLSFEQAASVPIAYLTAAYCLLESIRGNPGKRVLIHAATGGVGLAAVHLCQRHSAEIFATAGSEEKRRYLRSLGIKHVMDSRSTSFAQEIRSSTGGRGVDLVLNCLAGELSDAGLSVTSPSGEFIDIGATDVRDPVEVARQYLGVRYRSVDLAAALRLDHKGMSRMLASLLKGLDDGWLPPLPVERFNFDEAAQGFRHMAAARHIGKIVLGVDVPAAAKEVKIAGGSYIVTGGLTGLGLEVTRWLAAKGAARISVAGRREASLEVMEMFAGLRERGTEIKVMLGDVADPGTVSQLIETAGGGLRGVVHCAGTIDDAPIAAQSWKKFSSALSGKADGAWLLHKQTREQSLDFFVLFSSWSSIAGSPGAANYCAANMFLDSLAQHRHSLGLPATSINWGPWATVGMAAGKAGFAERGLRPMSPVAAMQAFELALGQAQPPQIAIADVDWARVAGSFKHRPDTPTIYGRTREFTLAAAEGERAPALVNAWINPSPASDRAVLFPSAQHLTPAQLKGLLLKVLELPPAAEIDPSQPLHQYGLDSILAVELASSISSLTGRQHPAGLLFDYPTLAALTDYVVGQKTDSIAAKPMNSMDETGSRGNAVLDRLEDLSDEEVDQLLKEKTLAG